MTRYPSAGKGNKWTVLELKSIPAQWKGDTLNDSEGLFGEVRVGVTGDVTISFRLAFKLNSKPKVNWHYCGIFPQDSMIDIRKARDEARESVKSGVDPRAKKIADKIVEQNAIEESLLRINKRLLMLRLSVPKI